MKHDRFREILTDIFTQTTEVYNFRQNRDFRILSVNTVYEGSESISYLGSKIWEIAPVKIINSILQIVSKKKSETGYHQIALAGFSSHINRVAFLL